MLPLILSEFKALLEITKPFKKPCLTFIIIVNVAGYLNVRFRKGNTIVVKQFMIS